MCSISMSLVVHSGSDTGESGITSTRDTVMVSMSLDKKAFPVLLILSRGGGGGGC